MTDEFEPGAAGASSDVAMRPMRADDAEAVAGIWRAGWADAHLGHVPAALVAARTPASFDERARDLVDGSIVATRGGRVVGFVTIDGDQVDQLYLGREARGGGIGSALLDAGARAIRAAGHERAWLAVATGNVAARGFYARQGWVDEGAFVHRAPVPDGWVGVDCHRFVSPAPGDGRTRSGG